MKNCYSYRQYKGTRVEELLQVFRKYKRTKIYAKIFHNFYNKLD